MPYLYIMLIVAIIDQLIKFQIIKELLPFQSITLIKGFFYLTYAQNYGAAFSILESHRIFLLGVTVAVFILVFIYKKQIVKYPLVFQWGLGLALGGALGNFSDRARLGYVVDYLDFRVWPVFNLADLAILSGVGLIGLGWLKYDSHIKKIKTEQNNQPLSKGDHQ